MWLCLPLTSKAQDNIFLIPQNSLAFNYLLLAYDEESRFSYTHVNPSCWGYKVSETSKILESRKILDSVL